MSSIVTGTRERTIQLTLILAILLAVDVALWQLPKLPPAAAQPATVISVVSDIPVTPVNGTAVFLLGNNDGVISIGCDGGSGPNHALGGPIVPAIVLDRLDPDATRLRITTWGLNTPAVNGQQVFITCTFESTTQAATLVRQLNQPAGRRLITSGTRP